ncbi:MAG: thioesterase [Gammaproteobacteria bacterium]|nr:thioesterase [Gammaproteobacteria bacterium]
MSNAWLQWLFQCSRAKARLICFPYAGVGAAIYRLWPTGLPKDLEVGAVQLPGRANRLHEPALTSIPRLVDALVPALTPHLDLPFAFFGHSMGAVLAYEVTQALRSSGGPLPKHLIVSGRQPPHLPNTHSLLHILPNDQFVAEIDRRYGGIPAEVLQDKDVMELLLPCLRADVTALETYHAVSRPPLACPITAFGGTEDALTPHDHLEAWRNETQSSFRVRVFSGDHFYLDPCRDEVLADLSATLAPMLLDTFPKESVA